MNHNCQARCYEKGFMKISDLCGQEGKHAILGINFCWTHAEMIMSGWYLASCIGDGTFSFFRTERYGK